MPRTSPDAGAAERRAAMLLLTSRATSLSTPKKLKGVQLKPPKKRTYRVRAQQTKHIVHDVEWFDRIEQGQTLGVDVFSELVLGLDSGRARTFLSSFNEIPKSKLLATVGISQRTLDRAIEKRSSLGVDVTDRLTRLAETRAKASKIFADSNVAERWLLRPLSWLGGNSPIELLKTSTGTEMVKEYLERIDRGVYA